MRVKMIVAYDGTNYKGWQVQPNGITIEEVLNKNLSNLLGEQIVVSGASRTDSGVHSLGNIAVFDTNTRMPADKIAFALNQRLPEDIVVQGSCEVEDGWHPRYQNSRKTYEYRILNRTFRMPTRRLDTYFYHYPLDVEKMKKAASYLEGEHDFKSFCAIGAQVKTTVRTIYACDVEKEARYHHDPRDGKRFPLQYGTDHCRDISAGWRWCDRTGGGKRNSCKERPQRGRAYGAGTRAYDDGDRV